MSPIILISLFNLVPSELLFVEYGSNSEGQSYNQLISIKGNQIEKSRVTDRGWLTTKEFSAEAKESCPEYLVVHWKSNPTTVEILKAPIKRIRSAQEGKYLLASTKKEGGDQIATTVFRKNSASLTQVRNCEREVIGVIDDCALGFSTTKKGEIEISAKQLKDDQTNQVLNQKAIQLYLSRTNYCKQDNFRAFDPSQSHSEIIVSPNCDYWFEKDTRVFISQGMNDSIHSAAHTLFDRKGLVCQWKYNFDSMRGYFFVNDKTFRFFCSQGFIWLLAV